MQTVNDSLPTSSPATRSNSTSTATTSSLTTVGGRRPEGPLPGHRPTRSQQQSEAPEDPAPYTSTGSPAPVCSDVAGRLEHSHPQGRRIKIANRYRPVNKVTGTGASAPRAAARDVCPGQPLSRVG